MPHDDQKPTHERKVLCSFRFLEGDAKWSGSVDVVERRTTLNPGDTRTYIDLVLVVGRHHLVIPWKGLDEIERALKAARAEGEAQVARLEADRPRRR